MMTAAAAGLLQGLRLLNGMCRVPVTLCNALMHAACYACNSLAGRIIA
jgi:hypothetical protein